jgi:hypothetical protein
VDRYIWLASENTMMRMASWGNLAVACRYIVEEVFKLVLESLVRNRCICLCLMCEVPPTCLALARCPELVPKSQVQ